MAISDIDPATPTAEDNAGLGDDQIRQFKTDVQVCFPAVDGEITNTGASQDAGDTDPPDAATFSALFTRMAALESGAGSVFPLGIIMLWNGPLNTIPSSWTLCNGTNVNNIEVPDLTDQFVMAAGGTYAPGAAGGAVGSGTTSEDGDHNHSGTHPTAISMAELPNELADAIYADTYSGPGSMDHDQTLTVATGDNNTENAPVSRNAPFTVNGVGGQGHTHGMAGSGTHAHSLTGALPPYYALAYICYVGPAP